MNHSRFVRHSRCETKTYVINVSYPTLSSVDDLVHLFHNRITPTDLDKARDAVPASFCLSSLLAVAGLVTGKKEILL
jgi:hypothetical protein